MADPNRPTLPQEIVEHILHLVSDESTLRAARQGGRLLNHAAKPILWRVFTDDDAVNFLRDPETDEICPVPTAAENPNLDDILVRCVRRVETEGLILRLAETLDPRAFLCPHLSELQISDGGLPSPPLLPESLQSLSIALDASPRFTQMQALARRLPLGLANLEIKLPQNMDFIPSDFGPILARVCSLELPHVFWSFLVQLAQSQAIQSFESRRLLLPSALPHPSTTPIFHNLQRFSIHEAPLSAAYSILRLLTEARLVSFELTLSMVGPSADLSGILAAASAIKADQLRIFQLDGSPHLGPMWCHTPADFALMQKYTHLQSLIISGGMDLSWLTLDLLREVLPHMPYLSTLQVFAEETRAALPLSFLIEVTRVAPGLETCGLPLDPQTAASALDNPSRTLINLDIGRSPPPALPFQTAECLLTVFPNLRTVSQDRTMRDAATECAWNQVDRYVQLRKAAPPRIFETLIPLIPAGLGVPELRALSLWDRPARIQVLRMLLPECPPILNDALPDVSSQPVPDTLDSFLEAPMPGLRLSRRVRDSWRISWADMHQRGIDFEEILRNQFSERRLTRFQRAAIVIGISRLPPAE